MFGSPGGFTGYASNAPPWNPRSQFGQPSFGQPSFGQPVGRVNSGFLGQAASDPELPPLPIGRRRFFGKSFSRSRSGGIRPESDENPTPSGLRRFGYRFFRRSASTSALEAGAETPDSPPDTVPPLSTRFRNRIGSFRRSASTTAEIDGARMSSFVRGDQPNFQRSNVQQYPGIGSEGYGGMAYPNMFGRPSFGGYGHGYRGYGFEDPNAPIGTFAKLGIMGQNVADSAADAVANLRRSIGARSWGATPLSCSQIKALVWAQFYALKPKAALQADAWQNWLEMTLEFPTGHVDHGIDGAVPFIQVLGMQPQTDMSPLTGRGHAGSLSMKSPTEKQNVSPQAEVEPVTEEVVQTAVYQGNFRSRVVETFTKKRDCLRFRRQGAAPREDGFEIGSETNVDTAGDNEEMIAAAKTDVPNPTPPRCYPLFDHFEDERKPSRFLINTERLHLQPLRLSVHEARKWCQIFVFAVFWNLIRLFADPGEWMEDMFSEETGADDGKTGKSGGLADDGLYRAKSSVHDNEPWNHERMHSQLHRSLLADQATDVAHAASNMKTELVRLKADEDVELLGCSMISPMLTFEGEALACAAQRIRSHVRSKRRLLYASELYELRLDITRVTLLRVPKDNPRFAYMLNSKECHIAAEMQEMYRRYKQETDTDTTSQLDGKLDALSEYGRELQQAYQHEQARMGSQVQGPARDAYLKHLEERRNFRVKRDAKECLMETLRRELYAKWVELKEIRQDQGFVSTPWKLRAQAEQHDLASDVSRRARNVEADVEEEIMLRSEIHPNLARQNSEHRWDMSKRPAGTPSWRFEVFAGEKTTMTEELRESVRECFSAETMAEIRRRKLARRTRVCVVCKIGENVVGTSPPFRLHWETLSTASASQVGAVDAHGAASITPLYSFDLAVHMMPQSVKLMVYVASAEWWGLITPWRRRWHHTVDTEVDIPERDGSRVTHAAVSDQVLRFGPLIAGGSEDDEDVGFESDYDFWVGFSGEVAARISWPGHGRDDGLVVPPPRSHPGLSNRRGNDGAFSARAVTDSRLTGLRYDPQDPETARMLLECPSPKALPGYDVNRLSKENCRLGHLENAALRKRRRVQKLANRAKSEGLDNEKVSVPAFDREVGHDEDIDGELHRTSDKRMMAKPWKMETQKHKDLLKRVRARVRKAALVNTHVPYKCIVKEHGDTVEPGNFWENLDNSLSKFRLYQSLVAGGWRERQDGAVRTVNLLAAVASVYHAPFRREDPQNSFAAAGRGLRGVEQKTFGRTLGSVGDYSHGIPPGFLPEIFVQMALVDKQGNALHCETRIAPPSADPDINQLLGMCLKFSDDWNIAQDSLRKFRGTIIFSIFDGVTILEPERGSETRLRHQRRYLGRFELPWETLYNAPKCMIRGHFRVSQPRLACGYQSTPLAAEAPRPNEDAGEGTPEAATTVAADFRTVLERGDNEPMYIAIDVMLDPILDAPRIANPPIVRGKEPKAILARVHAWLESFKLQPEKKVIALGMDMDGYSHLICRFIRPQKPPPHIALDDPFAIEAAARYVSLIPFVSDQDLFKEFNDLWCKDQEFLDLQCGDTEEHCILLCNYFNYIDTYRREKLEIGYNSCQVQSYCVKCDVIPEGDTMMVMRRDATTGHCEFWDAIRGNCYFVPLIKLGALDKLCSKRSKQPIRVPDEFQTIPGKTDSSSRLVAGSQICPSPGAPMLHAHVVFNSDNVWANLQPTKHDRFRQTNFDVNDKSCWNPLFRGGAAELQRLSTQQVAPTSVLGSLRIGLAAIFGTSGGGTNADADSTTRKGTPDNPWLDDPAQAIQYSAADEIHAQYLEHQLENSLEDQIMQFRAQYHRTGVQRLTRFNRVIADRLRGLLDDLERLESTTRAMGNEAVFPLRSFATPPVTLHAVQMRLEEIERDFQNMGRAGRSVFGLPFNHSYTEVIDRTIFGAQFSQSRIWEDVLNSRILEMGNESTEFALKVRVFAYSSRVFSLWVFLATACPYQSDAR